MSKVILRIEHLTKRYPDQSQPALEDFSLTLYAGESVGVIGANGSGKTTLFRLIMNLLLPDNGSIHWESGEAAEEDGLYPGYLPEHSTGLDNFTPLELLELAGGMMGLTREQIRTRSTELLEWAGLASHGEELLGGFSKGMRQRVLLALALIHRPQLLLLDEPMSGLDPQGQQELRRLLQSLPHQALLLATHRLEVVEWLCDRVVILHQGRIVGEVNLGKVTQQIFFLEGDAGVREALKKIPGVEIRNSHTRGKREKVELLASGTDLETILRQLKQRRLSVHRVQTRSILEELYRQYVEENSVHH